MTLFNVNLSDKTNWLAAREIVGQVLVKYIAKKEHLSGDLKRLDPSTNLIYRFGNKILKIFAPAVCGYQDKEDFNREIFGLSQLQDNADLRVPHILNGGCVNLQYNFYYLVIEWVDIPPASEFLVTCTHNQLNRFGGVLQEKLALFQDINVDVKLAKTRSQVFNSPLQLERETWLEAHRPKYHYQFVHADLSPNNILYDGKQLAFIDFEDWTYSAPVAEYPRIVFELLNGKRSNIESFFSKTLNATFIDDIFSGLLFHYDWEQFINYYCVHRGHRPASLTEARELFLADI